MERIKKIVNIAMLAGKIMLKSGCEVYRIEDTMNRILELEAARTHSVVVTYTGITLTLHANSNIITLTKRIRNRSTNLNKVYLVNEISRKLCTGEIDEDFAYARLQEIAGINQYSLRLKYLSYVAVVVLFTYIFGGNIIDCISSIFVGIAMALMHFIGVKTDLNVFCINALASFILTICAILLKEMIFFHSMKIDLIIIAAIMPLVPGMSFTTAIRDTLNGDYSSGTARILDAIVVALAIAVGVGAGIAAGGLI